MFKTFIKASNAFCTLEKFVPAPYFRESFSVHGEFKSATLYITGLGFYEAHINGVNITKGILAPYISNPEHIVYYDSYDISGQIVPGKNVLAVVLGNGFQNSSGGYIWDFDKANWRGAPLLSFKIIVEYADKRVEVIEPSAATKTAHSPIIFDDLRHGEYYDARLETDNWDSVSFDDSDWDDSLIADSPLGEQRLCTADPIVEIRRISPIDIKEFDGGYIYDFGVNFAGLTELNIEDCESGQKIVLKYFETLVGGKPYYDNIRFISDDRTKWYQENIYYCKGEANEKHLPRFTYDGFRYVYVKGINEKQAKKSLLTYIVYSCAKEINSTFSCSDETVNKIQQATVRSDISNLYYFPTDCPQREKNGWTADAALSAEQMLINLKPENCYKEWLRNIYKAMKEDGRLPGIVPTSGWGYEWGNGPAWDIVMINLPYYTYLYRGDKEILFESAEPINKYIHYLDSRLNDRNLLEIGLGDWCEPDKPEWEYTTPLVVTDTIVSIDIAKKAEFIFARLGLEEYGKFAKQLEEKLVIAAKEHLVDHDNLMVAGNTQTGLALALYHGLFDENEYGKAFENLLDLIKEEDNHCYCGVIGGYVFYELLAENGYADLALEIITKPDFPSYGNWIARGATTLWEAYRREGDTVNSLNHHFWGDISAWFYTYLAGIRINPTGRNVNEVNIKPCFVSELNTVTAKHHHRQGEISVEWKRTNGIITLNLKMPKSITGKIILPNGNEYDYSEIEKSLIVNNFVVNIEN